MIAYDEVSVFTCGPRELSCWKSLVHNNKIIDIDTAMFCGITVINTYVGCYVCIAIMSGKDVITNARSYHLVFTGTNAHAHRVDNTQLYSYSGMHGVISQLTAYTVYLMCFCTVLIFPHVVDKVYRRN